MSGQIPNLKVSQTFTKLTPLHRVYLYGCLCLDSTEHYTSVDTLVKGKKGFVENMVCLKTICNGTKLLYWHYY